MKSTFSVAGDGPFPAPSYDLIICFNGVPKTVVLEITRVHDVGYSGGSGRAVTEERRTVESVCRVALAASHARAIASALLGAATDAQRMDAP
jgi:hypothetical protein